MRLSDKEEGVLRSGFGIVPLQTVDGVAAFEYGLRQAHPQLVLMQGDREKIREVLGVEAPAALDLAAAVPATAVAKSRADLHGAVARHLAETFAAHLGIPPTFE